MSVSLSIQAASLQPGALVSTATVSTIQDTGRWKKVEHLDILFMG